jgi:hypothetical protein
MVADIIAFINPAIAIAQRVVKLKPFDLIVTANSESEVCGLE